MLRPRPHSLGIFDYTNDDKDPTKAGVLSAGVTTRSRSTGMWSRILCQLQGCRGSFLSVWLVVMTLYTSQEQITSGIFCGLQLVVY
jgi:hypothetical protein